MKTADNSSHRGWRLYPGAAQSQLVLATRAGQAGASSSPDVTAAASCHRATVPTPGTMAAAAAAAATAATASAAGDPAGAGSGGSVTRLAASAVNTDRTRSARRVKARSQPRTVEAGRPSRPAITRCPDPAAFASSARPITSPASARRARHQAGSSTCVRPHPRHRARRGQNHTSGPSGSRTRRSAALPHLASTPPHDGQVSSPPPSCRSTTSRSPFTVSTTPPRVNPAALPSPAAKTKKREGRAHVRRHHRAVAHEKGQPGGCPQTPSAPSVTQPGPYSLIPSDRGHLARRPPGSDPRQTLRGRMRLFTEFCAADPIRYQLLMERPIPGFAPAPESFQITVAALAATRADIEAAGVHGEPALDMFRALITGLVSLQIANDPGGDRWTRLQDDAFDMFLAHYATAARQAAQHPPEGR